MIADPIYPHHEDVEWLGVDRDGLIGRFTTGGYGPMPRCLLVREKDHRALRDLIDQQSPRSAAEVVGRVVDPQDFKACAEHGMFAYDWSDVHRVAAAEIRSYELMARPVAPLTFSWLCERAGDAAQILPRFAVSFRECSVMPVAREVDWVHP